MTLTVSDPAWQSHCFRDADLCSSIFHEWGVQFRQLAVNPFQGEISRWHGEDVSISRLRTNCRVEIIGEKPSDSIAFSTLLHASSAPSFTHGIPLQSDYIFGFDATRETNVVSSVDGFDLLVVQVNRSRLNMLAAHAGRDDLDDGFWRQNIFAGVSTHLDPYLQYLRQIVHLMEYQSQRVRSPQMMQLLEGDLLPLLLNALTPSHRPPKSLRRAEIVAAAQDYMSAHLHRPVTLTELSQAVCASRRSLIYGFQDIFGMGPMTYLKYQRLNGVRKALIQGHPEYETVMNIARLWGFYSPGHFARDYKAMFGELPSVTLQQTG